MPGASFMGHLAGILAGCCASVRLHGVCPRIHSAFAVVSHVLRYIMPSAALVNRMIGAAAGAAGAAVVVCGRTGPWAILLAARLLRTPSLIFILAALSSFWTIRVFSLPFVAEAGSVKISLRRCGVVCAAWRRSRSRLSCPPLPSLAAQPVVDAVRCSFFLYSYSDVCSVLVFCFLFGFVWSHCIASVSPAMGGC